MGPLRRRDRPAKDDEWMEERVEGEHKRPRDLREALRLLVYAPVARDDDARFGPLDVAAFLALATPQPADLPVRTLGASSIVNRGPSAPIAALYFDPKSVTRRRRAATRGAAEAKTRPLPAPSSWAGQDSNLRPWD